MNVTNLEFNDDLVGFVVTLDNRKIVQVQFDLNQNRPDANYGTYYPVIDTQNEYGLDLTNEEHNEFTKWMRKNPEILAKASELEAQAN
jgi:hypothetical protein